MVFRTTLVNNLVRKLVSTQIFELILIYYIILN